METTAVGSYPPELPGPLQMAVMDLPPLVALLLVLGLLALAAWTGRKGYPWLRALLAFDRAPTVDIASGAPGLVRVNGHAFPGDPVPEGFATPQHVWHVSSRYNTSSPASMARSGTYSVGKILVRDASGECVIDPVGALVVPGGSQGSVDRHMFDGATYRTEKYIATGAAVLALGRLRAKKARPDRPADLRIALRHGPGGLLLLSGKSERDTRRHVRWRALPATLLVCLCVVAAGWLASTHLLGYPEDGLGGFLRALTGGR